MYHLKLGHIPECGHIYYLNGTAYIVLSVKLDEYTVTFKLLKAHNNELEDVPCGAV